MSSTSDDNLEDLIVDLTKRLQKLKKEQANLFAYAITHTSGSTEDLLRTKQELRQKEEEISTTKTELSNKNEQLQNLQRQIETSEGANEELTKRMAVTQEETRQLTTKLKSAEDHVHRLASKRDANVKQLQELASTAVNDLETESKEFSDRIRDQFNDIVAHRKRELETAQRRNDG